jgi:hypothetical protein
MFFVFGLKRKTTRIALHARFWLSPGNAEAHNSYSQLPNLSQPFTEVKFGGRDKKGQAKSLIPSQSLVSSMLLGQTSLATGNIFSGPGKV